MTSARAVAMVFTVAALLGTFAPFRAGADPPAEYQIKAAYVSKLVRFVEWPDTHPPKAEMIIGVAGNAEFREAIEGLEGKALGEVRIRVRTVDDPNRLDGIHVLVVGPLRSKTRATAYLRAARDRPILTIGDAASFSREGGIIQFVIVEDSVRFAINVEAAERVGLVVSSRLLRLATNLR